MQTPRGGLALLPEHRSSTVVMRFDPIVASDGSLQVDHLLPDSPEGVALAASVRSGATPGLSIEFFSLDEAQVSGGARGEEFAYHRSRNGAQPELRPIAG